MNQKKTRFIFIILVTAVLITFIFSLIGSVFAQQIELEYPQIPGGASPPNEVRTLPNFIKYMFNFGIAIAGLVAFISLVYAGFRYTASAGNPGNLSDARDQIKASLLGLGLLLGSWLLLTTINPRLVVLQLSKEGASQQGIILFKDGCGNANGDTKSLQEGVQFLRVKNNSPDLTASGKNFPRVKAIKFLNSSAEIDVTIYPQSLYQGSPTFRSADLDLIPANSPCMQIDAASGSVKILWKRPGVYLFSKENCEGDAHLYVGDTATLGGADNFDNKAKSLEILPSITKVPVPVSQEELDRLKRSDSSKTLEPRFSTVITNKLGVILFENERFRDDGAVFLGGGVSYTTDPTKTTCVNIAEPCSANKEPYCKESVKERVSSLKVFHQYLLTNVPSGGQKVESEAPPSGDGVTLFGNQDFNDQDPGDSDRARDQQIHCGPINVSTAPASDLKIGEPLWVNGNESFGAPIIYPNTKNESDLKCRELFLNKWASSIRVDGDYIAVLFKDDGRAEVFESPGDNRLRENHIGNDSARYLLVIPIQK